MRPDPVVQQRSAEQAFGLVGDPLRVDILRALAEHHDGPVGFAALRRLVDEPDSGKFNYHLGKLLDSFVRKVEPEDGQGAGYELTMAGRQVVGALLAGTFTADVSLAPFPIGSDCEECGAELTAGYEAEHVVVECPDCGRFENRHAFPPGTVEQFDREELPAAFDRWLRASFARVVAGFCTTCGGRVTARLVRAADPAAPDAAFEAVVASYTCDRCGGEAHSSAYAPLLSHPAVVSFCYDHDLDVTATPSWELLAAMDSWDVVVVGEEPLRARVTITIDDEAVAVTLDETVSVLDAERRLAGTA